MSLLAKARWKAIPAGLVLLLFSACQEPPTYNEPYPNSTLALKALDVSSTEAWLRISLTGVDSTASATIPLILKRDGETVSTLDFVTLPQPGSGRADTTVMDAGLEPGRSYSYTAYRQSVHNTALIDSSAPVSLTTLDTTSHDFTWTIDTLGSYGSYLNDVAIIDANNIWVVGNIVVPDPDSSFNGTGWKEYNAARWDGERWNLMGIYSNTLDLYSIFYFSENDIWVTDYCSPIHWDGQEWTLYHLQNMGLDACAGNAIWGSSPEDVYFVGDHGSIVHYDGSGFERMESGTDVDLLDIWGYAENPGQTRIWIAGFTDLKGSVLLQFDGNAWQTVYEIVPPPPSTTIPNHLSWIITSVWTDNPYTVFCASTGRIYNTPWDTDGYAVENFNYDYQSGDPVTAAPRTNRIRGNNRNDIFVVGQSMWVGHYNGRDWRTYNELGGDGNYYAVALNGNTVVVAGTLYENNLVQRAIVAIGRR